MTKRIWTGVLTAIVGFATAAATAQTPSSPQSNTSSADRRIVVTGCLKEAPSRSAGATAMAGTTGTATAGTAGTTGTTATAATTGDTAATATKFLLTNATSSPAAASAAASATEPTPTGAAGESGAQTFRLIANPESLSPHVGKKLELTGTLEDQDGATGTAESSSASEANATALKVESGKIVALSCSQ